MPWWSQLWYDTHVPEAEVVSAWELLAGRFCHAWNVLGADLFNEPHAASWGRPWSTLTDWRRGAMVLGDAVLSRCPRWLVFMSGVGEASLACQPKCEVTSPSLAGIAACLQMDFDLSCKATPGQTPDDHFWGGNLEGAFAPGGVPTLREPSRLVFSSHVYGPSVFEQAYFKAASFPANLPEIWDAQWAAVPMQTGVPVVVTEWGGWYAPNSSSVPPELRPPGPELHFSASDVAWQDAFLAFLLERRLGSFYWSLNPNSRDTGGLLGQMWQTEGHSALSTRKLSLLSQIPGTRILSLLDGIPPLPPPLPPFPPPPPPPPLPPSALRVVLAWLASVCTPLLLLGWLYAAYRHGAHSFAVPRDGCAPSELLLAGEESGAAQIDGNVVTASAGAPPTEGEPSEKQKGRHLPYKEQRGRLAVPHHAASPAAPSLAPPSRSTPLADAPADAPAATALLEPQTRSSGPTCSSSRWRCGLLQRPSEGGQSIQRLRLAEVTASRPCRREGRVVGWFYCESRPVCGTRYFERSDAGSTAVVVCLSDEEGSALRRTLNSLLGHP